MEAPQFIPPQRQPETSESDPISTEKAPELGIPQDIDRQVIVDALLTAEHDQLSQATGEVR